MAIRALPVVLVLTLLLVLISAPLQIVQAAGPFTVNTTSDTHCTGFVSQSSPGCSAATDGSGNVSLRSALEFASTAGGTTTINLPSGTYNLSLGDLVAGTQANTNITIHGTGTSANTTIHQTQAGRMVILVNYPVAANVVLNVDNVTISGGSENENDPDGFGGNGGAILAGGSNTATGNSVSFTNVVFSGNYCSPVLNAGCSGGAINMTGGGNLTVSNSTFSGNDASKNSGTGSGGAIYFDNGGNGGNVSITNSTFTNNTAHASGGQGGAVRLAGGAGSTYTVNNNVFTGNSATQNGGALYLSLGSLTANFNRIVGNISNSGSGLYVANNSGSIGSATNNWWGCNGGPTSGVGCDTAVLGTPNQGGSMTVSPWIVLTNTASPNPIMVNQTTTLTADFLHNSANGALTTAQISRLIGLPVTWGSAVRGTLSGQQTTIQSNGTATATFTSNAAGAGSAAATVDNGTGTASITINKANTSTSLTSDTPDPSVTGQPVTVNFSVSSSTGSTPTAPTGNVTVGDGVDSCTASLATGTCTITFTSAGSKSLTATYNGDANFNTSISSPATPHTVNKADTTTTIVSNNPDPSVVGQTVAVSYTVTVNVPGSGTPTGNVTVTDGVNNCVGSIASGTCNMSFTSPGSRSLMATYAGDGNYNGSTSASVPHQVNKADTTTTILSDLPDPSNIGQSVVVSYSVSVNDPGSGTPTGSVTVSDGPDSCSSTVAASSCTINFSSAGTKTLTATYAGDSKFNGSTSASVSHQVNQANTTTAIASSLNPSLFGQAVTFTATVTSTVGVPTGSVTFRDGATPFVTIPLSSGMATFTSAALAVGSHAINTQYAGDADHLGSTASLTQVVQEAPIAGLNATSSSPTVLGNPTFFTATLSAGSNVTFTWNFGDHSAVGSSLTTSHTYSAAGHYQVVVTATNSVSVVTATTSVLVLSPRVFLPLVLRDFSAAVAFVDPISTGDLKILDSPLRIIRRP